jgi:hypothetical protein
MSQKQIRKIIIIVLTVALTIGLVSFIRLRMNEVNVLKKIIARLEAESRIAEVLVTGVNLNEEEGKVYTTIKFVEYKPDGEPLLPKYFIFTGNIIQFQSLVIRFDDIHIRNADKLRGKSAYLFWKVFMLDGANTEEYEITPVNTIPEGYRVEGLDNAFEKKLWSQFWKYALDPRASKNMGIKNAQIEAPGTMFVPGVIYTLKLEHDGGIRIDTAPVPHILKGEYIKE